MREWSSTWSDRREVAFLLVRWLHMCERELRGPHPCWRVNWLCSWELVWLNPSIMCLASSWDNWCACWSEVCLAAKVQRWSSLINCCAYIRVFVCVYVCVCLHVCICVYMCTMAHRVCDWLCGPPYVCVCMYCVRVCPMTHTHTHTHTTFQSHLFFWWRSTKFIYCSPSFTHYWNRELCLVCRSVVAFFWCSGAPVL